MSGQECTKRCPFGCRIGRLGLLLLTLSGCAEVGTRAYFRELDEALTREGLLRTDRLARTVPYSNAELARNFRNVAFGFEVILADGRDLGAGPLSDDRLKRWRMPIRYRLSGNFRSYDRAEILSFARRLSRLTGLDIEPAGSGEANLTIHILSPAGRDLLAEDFAARPEPSPQEELFAAWKARPRWPCAGEIYYQPQSGARPFEIEFAVIYIRDELGGISRQSCIEEEMSQSLGLARDDRAARPSIFNDDEEFALLTEHDEYLLRILYDPRLRPGMSVDIAMPIVEQVVAELRP